MLTAMARSTIKVLKQQGQPNTTIADLVGCDRHTVARVVREPIDPPRRRRLRPSPLDRYRPELASWLQKDVPVSRMLELVRQDPREPYTGGASTCSR
jgi:hypothetical protein